MKYGNFAFTALAATLLSLSACSDDGSQGDGSGAVTPASGGQGGAALGAPAPGEMAPGFASVYTEFDLDKCEEVPVEEAVEEDGRFTCAGFGKIPLFAEYGDGRLDLDAGVDDNGFQTLAAFNDIGDAIEWRLDGGTPFAMIFRYHDRSGVNPGRTVLAVETIGAPDKLGCRVVHIAGDTPDANQLAREKADAAAAPGFVCPDEPELIGEAG